MKLQSCAIHKIFTISKENNTKGGLTVPDYWVKLFKQRKLPVDNHFFYLQAMFPDSVKHVW